jgi:hypothetical protein
LAELRPSIATNTPLRTSFFGIGTNLTETIPASVQVGDLMLFMLAYLGGTAPNAPAGWTLVGSDSTYARFYIWYRIATDGDTGGSTQYTWNAGGATVNAAFEAWYSVSGAPLSIDVSAFSSFSGANPTVPAVTTTGPNRIVQTFVAGLNASTPTLPAGEQTIWNNSGAAQASGWYLQATQGTTPTQQFINGSMNYELAQIAIVNGSVQPYALVAFDGTAGQPMSLNITNSTFRGCFGQVQVTVYRPDGVALASITPCVPPNAIIPDLVLPITGTYAILVTPAGSNTGQMDLTVYTTPDVTGTIAVGGKAVTIANTVPGQDMTLTFAGTAGTPVSFNITGNGFGYCGGQVQVTITILNPDGSQLAQLVPCSPSQVFPDITLPQNGTYTIFIEPSGPNVGAMTLQIYKTPDAAAPIVLGGVPVTVSNTVAGQGVPGQDMRLTFSAAAGQITTLNMTGSTFPGCFGQVQVTVSLLDPNNNTLASMTPCFASASMGPVTLPSTGTYSIFAHAANQNVGSMTLQLWNLNDASSSVNTTDTYSRAVLADTPMFYWRLDESALATALNAAPAIAHGVAGPTLPDSAINFRAATSYISTSNQFNNPTVYSVEAWIKTITTQGGKIIGFENSQTGAGGGYDRMVYMTNSGQLIFGHWTGNFLYVTSSASYNDGNWHHVVGTYDGSNMRLYVDGSQAAATTGAGPQNFSGWWKIGYGNLNGWPSAPSSYYFQGSLGEVAVWNSTALTPTQVSNHHNAAGGGNYDSTVLGDSPTSFWKLNESSGTTFADASGGNNRGTAHVLAVNGLLRGQRDPRRARRDHRRRHCGYVRRFKRLR